MKVTGIRSIWTDTFFSGCPSVRVKTNCGHTYKKGHAMSGNFDADQLILFTGTERYYRISRKHLLTEGTKYVAENAGAFWMMDAAASHLNEIGTDDWFVLVRVTVTNSSAVMRYEDGNGNVSARQSIPYTDFPLPSFMFYACWDGEHWVLMLPSEY